MIASFCVSILLLLVIDCTCFGWELQSSSILDCGNQYWLHVPKTSSAFCLSLHHVCCHEQFETAVASFNTSRHIAENEILSIGEKYFTIETKHGCAELKSGINPKTHLLSCHIRTFGHKPYSPAFPFRQKQALVVLRHPKSRVFSALIDGVHREGMKYEDYDNLRTRMINDTRSRELFQYQYPGVRETVMIFVYSAFVYINDPMIIGCQTKMILGHHCADSNFILPTNPVNITLIEEAKKRLKQFYFVGNFEEYQKTIELFHQISSNGTTTPSVIELLPIRQSNQLLSRILQYYFSNYSDPYDDAIYEEGKRIFNQQYSLIFNSTSQSLRKSTENKEAVEIVELRRNNSLDLNLGKPSQHAARLPKPQKSKSSRDSYGKSRTRVSTTLNLRSI
jgi:hypothetical protein